MSSRNNYVYRNKAGGEEEVYSPSNPQDMLPPPVNFGNESNSETPHYYKVMEVQLPPDGAWEDTFAIVDFIDSNYANDRFNPCSIMLGMHQEGAYGCWAIITQLSGDRATLGRLYMSHNNASGSKVSLYFLSSTTYSSIGVRVHYVYDRQNIDAYRWKVCVNSAGLDSLPSADNNLSLLEYEVSARDNLYFQMPVWGDWNRGINVCGSDFNDYVMPGFYELVSNPSMANAPSSNNNPTYENCNWYLLVFRRGGTYVGQVAFSVRSDCSAQYRTMINGKWTAWTVLGEQMASICQGVVVYNGHSYIPTRIQAFNPGECYDITDTNYTWTTITSGYQSLADGQLYYFNGSVKEVREDEDLGEEGKVMSIRVGEGGLSGVDDSWYTAFKNGAYVYAYQLEPITYRKLVWSGSLKPSSGTEVSITDATVYAELQEGDVVDLVFDAFVGNSDADVTFRAIVSQYNDNSDIDFGFPLCARVNGSSYMWYLATCSRYGAMKHIDVGVSVMTNGSAVSADAFTLKAIYKIVE